VSAHYLVRCTGCKAIIEQCRCPGPKVEREGRCNTCDTPDEIAAKDAEIEALKSKTPHTSCWAEIETLKARAEKAERERDEARDMVTKLVDRELTEKARAEKAEREVDILKGVRNTWRAEVAAQKERYDVMAGKALAAEARAEKAERERDEARAEEKAQRNYTFAEHHSQLDCARTIAKLTEALREIAEREGCPLDDDCIAAAALAQIEGVRK
jgi:hypothetical protein